MQWNSWHNHTGDEPRFSYCADAALTPEVYRRALRGGPWHAFALTEHAFAIALPDDVAWPYQWYNEPERLWAHRAFREDKTAQFLDRIARVCDGARIFSGLEVEVARDGQLSMEAPLWPYLDVVIGSLHHLPGPHAMWPDEHFAQLDMLLRYPIDILGHPFRAISQAGPVPDEVIDETLYRIREAGVAVEINAHMPFARDADVLARAVHMGIPIAFGLDAHHRRELELHTYFDQVVAASGIALGDIRQFRPIRKAPKPRQLVR